MGGEHIVSVTPVGCLLKVQQSATLWCLISCSSFDVEKFLCHLVEANEEKAEGSMSLLLLARSTAHSENAAVPSLGQRVYFNGKNSREERKKNYPAEPNSQLIAFRDRERGEKEVEAGGSYWA